MKLLNNKILINEMETELYKHFSKMNCGYYRKTDNYVINFFRSMLKEIGYKSSNY